MKTVTEAQEIKDYAENMRKFCKHMLSLSHGTSDEQYYLGRMHSAKMIRDWIGKVSTEKSEAEK